jgi:hypothetical protein
VSFVFEAAAVFGGGYLLLLLVHPVHRCPSCRGAKAVPHGKRFRPCRRCKGHGRGYRHGGILVQRAVQEHAWPWVRDRIHDAIAKRTGDQQ